MSRAAGELEAAAPAAATGAALDLRDLVLHDVRDRVLVDGATVRVAPGQAVGLVGESGSGKTLTVRTALGLVPSGVSADASCVRLAGEDVYGLTARERRRLLGTQVGYVPQNSMAYLHPAMRVHRQLTDGYRTWHRGEGAACVRERATGLLAAVGIDDPARVLKSYPAELSGGQRQRVNIAMALMGDPAIVVADEATAALDSDTASQVADVLSRTVAERGAALLMVSHDLDLVRERCDRVYVMYAGRVVEEGPCAAVLHDPGHPYTRGLLDAVPRVGSPRDGRLSGIPGTMPEKGRGARACLFAPRCPLACEECRTVRPVLAGADGHLVACCRRGGAR